MSANPPDDQRAIDFLLSIGLGRGVIERRRDSGKLAATVKLIQEVRAERDAEWQCALALFLDLGQPAEAAPRSPDDVPAFALEVGSAALAEYERRYQRVASDVRCAARAEEALSAMMMQRDVLQEKLNEYIDKCREADARAAKAERALETAKSGHIGMMHDRDRLVARVTELEALTASLQDQCDTWRDAAERADEALEERR